MPGMANDNDKPTHRAVPSGRGGQHRRKLPTHLRTALVDGARKTRTTVFAMMLAALGATLARCADQDDVVIGSPMDGRTGPELGRTVGMFANTVALRLALGDDPTVADVRAMSRRTVAEALAYGSTPFDDEGARIRLRRSDGTDLCLDVIAAPYRKRDGSRLTAVTLRLPASILQGAVR